MNLSGTETNWNLKSWKAGWTSNVKYDLGHTKQGFLSEWRPQWEVIFSHDVRPATLERPFLSGTLNRCKDINMNQSLTGWGHVLKYRPIAPFQGNRPRHDKFATSSWLDTYLFGYCFLSKFRARVRFVWILVVGTCIRGTTRPFAKVMLHALFYEQP